jgi:hypothetical protein
MDVTLTFGLAVFAILMLALTFIFDKRSIKVFRFRANLIDQIDKVAKTDMQRGIYFLWKADYEIFRSISFERMIQRFWIPLTIKDQYSKYPDFVERMSSPDEFSRSED